jgi:Holliday junction resolvasome RuvABC endonuclease subunit
LAKYKIEDLRVEAEALGWQLLSEEYKNLDTELEYKCDKGHTIYSTYKKIRKGYICPICKEFNGSTELNFSEKPISKPKDAYRILAIDQSTKISGYSIFDNDVLIRYGAIEIKGSSAPIRFAKVREWIRYMIETWKPNLVIIEDIQLQDEEETGSKSVITFKILAQLIGVLKTYFCENGIEYDIANVSTWRNCEQIKGRTRTDKKKSAQLRVKKCYNIDVTDDVADAILIGRYAIEKRKEQQEENNVIHWE